MSSQHRHLLIVRKTYTHTVSSERNNSAAVYLCTNQNKANIRSRYSLFWCTYKIWVVPQKTCQVVKKVQIHHFKKIFFFLTTNVDLHLWNIHSLKKFLKVSCVVSRISIMKMDETLRTKKFCLRTFFFSRHLFLWR